MLSKSVIKGELQRQSKLISSERPFKNLQKKTKIIKIGKPFSRYSTFKIKNQKCCVLEVLHRLKNNRLRDVRNDKCTIQQ